MATPNIVPRADSEGGIGTSSKYWASAYIDAIYVGAGFVGRDADNRVDFAVDNIISFKANGANRLHVGSNQIYPETNNALSLGYATREFSDLFLGDGAVINFNNGNVTLTHSTGSLTLADSDALGFGNSNDLKIQHDGSDGYLTSNTGHFYIEQKADDSDIIFTCDDGSGGTTTYLTLDGSVAKTTVSRPLLFADNISAEYGADTDMIMYHSGGAGYIEHYTGNFNIIQHTNDGDIILSCDDGSGGTTEYLRLDGGSENITVSKRMAFIDNAEIYLGTGSDFYLWHNGSNTYMYNNTGDFVIQQRADNADITFGCDDGAGSVATYFYLDGSSATHDGSATTALYTNWPDKSRITVGTSHDLQIYHDGSTTMFQNQTGNLKFRNFADDSDIMFETDDGSGSYTEYLRLDGSEVETTFFVNTRHNDSVSAKFGTSGDLSIQHNGSNSYITANGTGDLYIKQMTADQHIYFQNDDGSGGEVNYLQLDGANVRTTFIKPGRFLDTVQLQIGTSADLKLYHNATDSIIENENGDLYIVNDADDKDIIFQCEDGSGGLETYFFLDGSATSGSPVTIFPDSSYLYFGDGLDFSIAHNGSNTLVSNITGNLYFDQNTDNGSVYFRCDDGSGALTTYFQVDGASEILQVHKSLFALDNIRLRAGSAGDLSMYHDGTDSYITNDTGHLLIYQNGDDKDIIFRNDNGSGGTTPYLTLDGGDVSTIVNTIKVLMPNLPTSDPSTAGQLWNDSGTLKISAG